jgi:hypothetical protein
MDNYYEKNIVNEEVRNHPQKLMFWVILRIVFSVFLAVGILILLNFLDWFQADAKKVFFNILVFALVIFPGVGGILFSWRMIRKINCEYDYFISGTEIRFVRIINSKKRVTILRTELVNIEKVGYTDTEAFALIAEENRRSIPAYCNKYDKYLYITFTVMSEKVVVICEPDDDFVRELKKIAPSYGVFEAELRSIR